VRRRTKRLVQASGPIALKVDGDEGEAKRFESLDQPGDHLRGQGTWYLLGRELEADQIIVVSDTEVSETQPAKRVLPFFDDTKLFGSDGTLIGNPR
jgi:hypothetical protein